MKQIIIISIFTALSLQAADSIDTWFSEGKVKGNVRYYYIETTKDKSDGSHSSAHSNAVGGQLSYTTADWSGFSTGVSFMTTHGFALPNVVDASTIGRDNGVRLEGSAGGEIAQDSFSVLGEAFLEYKYKDLSLLYGRKVIKTPLIHAKDVRMLPSAVQGGFIDYNLAPDTIIGLSYLTHFKQRSSDKFTNIIKHTLGDATKTVTADDQGEIIVANIEHKNERAAYKLYNYYADNFLNSLYLEADFKNTLESGLRIHAAGQFINQKSIGNADDNLNEVGSITGGERISSNALGFILDAGYKESKLAFSLSKVLSDSDKHNSLVTPWDGTPLFTDMITANSLFSSNYGQGLKSDSMYIGGSLGIRIKYTQKYDFTGIKGFKTSIAYLNINNSQFANNQRDYNIVLAYSKNSFTLAAKGIWVRHSSSESADGVINQDDKLRQIRVIANYNF